MTNFILKVDGDSQLAHEKSLSINYLGYEQHENHERALRKLEAEFFSKNWTLRPYHKYVVFDARAASRRLEEFSGRKGYDLKFAVEEDVSEKRTDPSHWGIFHRDEKTTSHRVLTTREAFSIAAALVRFVRTSNAAIYDVDPALCR